MNAITLTYGAALRAYLAQPTETTLRAAYELGRQTVGQEGGLLDLCVAHDDALAAVFEDKIAAAEVREIVRKAGEFFLECISAFEMVQRGVRDAHEATRVERRHAEMLRGLSAFLSDSSLALEANDALAEMRRLVAEQAREFVRADCCLVTTGASVGERSSSHSEDHELGWRAFVRWADLSAVEEVVCSVDGATRLDGTQCDALLAGTRAGEAGRLEIRGWLGAPLTALGGHRLGAIHLVNRSDGQFTEFDEAIVMQLAQMSAAAVERTQLYGGGPPPGPAHT